MNRLTKVEMNFSVIKIKYFDLVLLNVIDRKSISQKFADECTEMKHRHLWEFIAMQSSVCLCVCAVNQRTVGFRFCNMPLL